MCVGLSPPGPDAVCKQHQWCELAFGMRDTGVGPQGEPDRPAAAQSPPLCILGLQLADRTELCGQTGSCGETLTLDCQWCGISRYRCCSWLRSGPWCAAMISGDQQPVRRSLSFALCSNCIVQLHEIVILR